MRKDGLHGWAVGEGAAVYRTERRQALDTRVVHGPGPRAQPDLSTVRHPGAWAGCAAAHIVRPGTVEAQWGDCIPQHGWWSDLVSDVLEPVVRAGGAGCVQRVHGHVLRRVEPRRACNQLNEPAVAQTVDRTAWTGPQVIDATITDVVPGDYDQAAPGRYVAVGGGSPPRPSFALTSGNYGGSWAPGTLPASSAPGGVAGGQDGIEVGGATPLPSCPG